MIEKVERLKLKAEQFLSKNQKAFVKDIDGTYYFCIIINVGETYLYIEDFIGKRAGERNRINWYDIIELKEYVKGEGE